MNLADVDALKEQIKNYGKKAIENGIQTLDPVDDIVKITELVDLVPKYDAGIIWHKVTMRPTTDEEKAYYTEQGIEEAEYIFDCIMPEDGQEILIATISGVHQDIAVDDYYGCGLESTGDWDCVLAWTEMPQYEE